MQTWTARRWASLGVFGTRYAACFCACTATERHLARSLASVVTIFALEFALPPDWVPWKCSATIGLAFPYLLSRASFLYFLLERREPAFHLDLIHTERHTSCLVLLVYRTNCKHLRRAFVLLNLIGVPITTALFIVRFARRAYCQI